MSVSPQTAADASLLDGFEEEAASTLEAEIALTKPDVIVFVTNHFCEGVVRLISNGHADSDWNKSENESNQLEEADIWWKRRPDGIAVLWMHHPMRAKKEHRLYGAAKTASLACVKLQ